MMVLGGGKRGNLKANPNGPIDDRTSPWPKTAAVATPLQRALDRIEGTILNSIVTSMGVFDASD